MAAFLLDTFTHGGGTTGLETHAPETGGAWVQAGNLFAAQNVPVFIYAAGYASGTSTTPINCAYNNVLPPSADVKITFACFREEENFVTNLAVWFRCAPTPQDAYRLTISNQRVQIHRVNARTYTLVGSSDNGTGVAGGLTPVNFEVLAVGGELTVTRNGVVILAVVDPAPLTANGFVGVGAASLGRITQISAEDGAGGPTSTIGTSAGASTVTGNASALKAATGTISAGASSSFVSMKFQTGFGTIIGEAVVTGVGLTLSDVEGIGTITAGAAVQGVGQSIREAVGTAEGQTTSEWSAAGLTVGETEGSITAGATVVGAGERVMSMLGMITAVASSQMIGSSLAETTSAIEGVAEMLGVGRSFEAGETDGTVSASTTVNGVGEAIIAAVGTISGSSTVTGNIVTGSIGRITGTATVAGRGVAIKAAVGQIAGSTTSNVVASQFEGSEGISRGTTTLNGVGHAVIETTGTISAAADSYFLSFGVTVFETPPERTIVLAREDRSIVVKAEDRSIVLPRSVMSVTTEIESRTIVVTAENRTITVAAENRTIIVNPEDRKITL